jgi:hypothetical protein
MRGSRPTGYALDDGGRKTGDLGTAGADDRERAAEQRRHAPTIHRREWRDRLGADVARQAEYLRRLAGRRGPTSDPVVTYV